MVATDRVTEVFTDARTVHSEALERLQAGDIRDAAEKAWCATKRATDALILARTGDEPVKTPATSQAIRTLARQYQAVRQAGLVARYFTAQGILHGDCFYSGLCEPVDDTEQHVRETIRYIQDAERLAGSIG